MHAYTYMYKTVDLKVFIWPLFTSYQIMYECHLYGKQNTWTS